MASAEVIEEISQFYDIKQKDNGKYIIYYIKHCDIGICIGIKYVDSGYFNYTFNANIEILKKYIDKNILLINKINEMFEFTYKSDGYGFYVILVGSVIIYYQYRNDIYVVRSQFYEKNYDNMCDIIEYLKQSCPECIKSGDIKIALKD